MDDSFEDSFEELSDEYLPEETLTAETQRKENVGILKRMLNLFWKTRYSRNIFKSYSLQ